ncbi:MAG: SusC/RagA family TonB-linked outer membrane protein [Ginsengibacter sp.]
MRRSISKISKQIGVLMFFVLVAFGANAQNTVTGKVTDSKAGNGIQGVTVTVKGTKKATQTDVNGDFSIVAAPNATLVISSVGYTDQEVAVNHQSAIQVQLVVSAEKLGEVVIIGYGTVKKKDLTGSVSQVNAKDFQSGQITSPEGLIAGKVPGVSIISGGGAPGAGSTIRIRGGASLSASNNPLIVIDGVPLDDNGIAGAANPLSLIDPNDIESFSILKDASATAIYGSRASNGVIIITTKRGRVGAKPVIDFGTNLSLSKITKDVDVLSTFKFLNFVLNNGNSQLVGLLGKASTDWQKQIYQTAITSDNNLSVTGGYKNMPYRISVGYLNQQGILKTDKLDRYSFGVNVNPRFFDNHLKVDISVKNSIEEVRFANQDAIGAAVSFDPSKPVYSGNSDYNGYWEWLDPLTATGLKALAPKNPVGLLMDKHDIGEVRRSVGNALIDYKIHFFPDLHAIVNLGYDVATSVGTITVDPNAAQAYLRSPDAKHGGVYDRYLEKRNNKTLEAYLNYIKDIGTTNINAVAGYGYYDFTTTKFGFPDLTTDGTAITTPSFPFDRPRYVLMSYWGRVNVSFNDRYLFTGSVRTDGSSRFAEDERWGVFPAGAFAWNMKNEGFLRNSKTISQLKLRLGYGLTGQQSGIGYYDYNSFYGFSDGTSQYQLGNTFYHMYAPGGYYPQRTWEQTATYNAGVDYGFFDNRINGSVDVYYKKTTNLLNNISQPAGSNFSNQIVANVGDMENKGVEFSINLQPVKNKNVVWDLNLNATYNENKITKLTTVPSPNYPGNQYQGISGGTGNTILINTVDLPRGSFYVYKQVYDQKGKPIDGLLDDLNRDGVINEKDKYQYKNIDPAYLFGASTNLRIKEFNVGFVLRASLENYVYNNTYSSTGTARNILNPINVLNNGSVNVLESGFSGNNDKYFLSDYYIENASFIRMDNAYVSYNLGRVFNNTADLSVSANVQNVFVITKYKGLDPEIANGVDNNFYPRPRVYSLGLRMRF